MAIDAILAFTGAFVVLAVSPGPGLVAILSRTLGGGYASGLAVTAGLVVGDAVFLAIAMVGLSAIASAMGPLFQIVKYAGAAYLIWLGIQAFRSAGGPVSIEAARSKGLARDVLLGLVVTLGNPKPIIFYGALLPTFLDLSRIGVIDFVVLMSVVVAVSFVVYVVYMVLARRAGRMLVSSGTAKRLNQTTGVMLVGSGLMVAAR
ncbi:MAG: LysE family translocator [Bosea sp.]|jgi:threonine/homoserine/homoserine lactone efflux protein|nr:LysE family translocator [Bosea sp. (in: a-proteobacteria)]